MNKNFNVLLNGIIKENPITVLLLGMCPTLATTSSAINGMSMGLATMFVLICSNAVISMLKNMIPDMVRIPAFIVVIATFVTVIEMIMNAYVPALAESLGIFLPLIVVNCIVLGRAESFAAKNSVVSSIFDGAGMGLGFTLSLTILGSVRELLGAGTIFSFNIYPEHFGSLLFILAPGAFIVLGYMISLSASAAPLSPATVEKRTNISVCFPISENIFALVYCVISCVTVNVPYAPDPLACILLSGITSLSKCASFSKNHTSCSIIGPRGPAVIAS
jgi:electron transport complex protein RnfE